MSKFRKSLVENKGFTLIELLVVIAILGILAAIAVPRLAGFTDRAREANVEAGGETISSNVELYIAENGKPPVLSVLTTSSSDYYIKTDEGYDIAAPTTTSAEDYEYTLTGDGYVATITPTGVSVAATS
ncbi:MAG TPA: prepilin-type N-terminal cleavage/methylation domain-containing protein [Halanaerobiales bacterium]|nr:prepilin-type N-terminal cleavage/methylation domain-containing protein [Halanaerobiales bacterium]